MDAPKCRLCEKRHWGACNSFLMDPVVVSVKELIANVVANSKHGKYADKEKRRKSQRDLMRKRRAEKNAS